ncbi:MAG TPA: NBR1-Ig-like domain-containing protein [Anaerolineaceae bacterium]|nr:NBR1-Ig-like domain-containing protein [Anaerolineaceae bacterium]
MKQFKTISLFIVVVAMILSACKPNSSDASPTDQLDDIRTVAARTIEALTTQMLQTDYARQTETRFSDNETPTPPSEVFPATDTAVPSASFDTTPVPTDAVPTEVKPCDLAFFEGETIPDGSELYPGTVFQKTWTLRNEGNCTWTKDYSVVFISGDSMSAPAVMPLTEKDIKPGESLVITMPLVAPTLGGEYRAHFKLRNAAGVIFAFRNPDHSFWADIKVVEGKIHLVHAYCGAQWSSQAGTLHCPGQPGDAGGYVYSDNAPVLETGGIDDEPTLWLGLGAGQDSYIMGVYPAMKIPEKAQFSTVLGCGYGLSHCHVKFSLAYQEGEGQMYELGSWEEHYDEQFTKIALDLSALGGRTVKIILIARAMGSAEDGKIHLLEPVIKP